MPLSRTSSWPEVSCSTPASCLFTCRRKSLIPTTRRRWPIPAWPPSIHFLRKRLSFYSPLPSPVSGLVDSLIPRQLRGCDILNVVGGCGLQVTYSLELPCPCAFERPGTLFRGLANGDALLDIELQNVVEAIEGAAQRDAPRQLDDLGFGEMLAQPGEDLVARLVPVIGDGDGIFDQQRPDVLEDRRPVRHHAGLIFEGAIGRHLVPQRPEVGGQIIPGLDRHA